MRYSTWRRSDGSSPQAPVRKASRSSIVRSSAALKISSTCSQRSGVILRTLIQLTIKPGLGHPPLADHLGPADTQDFSHFFQRHSTEIFQLNDAPLFGIEFSQSFQSVIKREELVGALVRNVNPFIERDDRAAAAALSSEPRPGMINQNAAHRLGGDGEKVGAVLPTYVLLIY